MMRTNRNVRSAIAHEAYVRRQQFETIALAHYGAAVAIDRRSESASTAFRLLAVLPPASGDLFSVCVRAPFRRFTSSIFVFDLTVAIVAPSIVYVLFTIMLFLPAKIHFISRPKPVHSHSQFTCMVLYFVYLVRSLSHSLVVLFRSIFIPPNSLRRLYRRS